MSETVRNPQQQRSIDKKNRIIAAGYELFAEKGYFNTNTAEIAKRAGVSTGIVYGYFRDKRDILIEVLDIYIEQNCFPIYGIIDELTAPVDFERVILVIVDRVVEIHKNNAGIHEALYSLSSYDESVNSKFMAFEEALTSRLCQKITSLGYEKSDLAERVHLAIELIQSYAHECVYDRHSYINYDNMHRLIVGLLSKLF